MSTKPSATNHDGAQIVSHHEHVGASNSLRITLKIADKPGMLGKVTTFIGSFGADVGETPIKGYDHCCTIREIIVNIKSLEQRQKLEEALNKLDDVTVLSIVDRTMELHENGKIAIVPRTPITEPDHLSMQYTPGVARACIAVHENPELAWKYTMKGNTIAIVTDGSRLLSLGNFGKTVPASASPVMEGKAATFYTFGKVNAIPLCLKTQDADAIIETVINISPVLGGVNLEDIESPKCWYIERKLKEALDIPVFHDDQHGTAVVVLAATINASRVVKKQLRNLRVRVSGVGAAGMACCRLLLAAGVRNLIGYNIGGAIYEGRPDMNDEEKWLAAHSNRKCFKGTLRESLKDADMFLGLSAKGVIDASDLAVMRRDPIVFALANPAPEVDPNEAEKYAKVVATGGSEYRNQVNNALVYPGIFRGALDARVRDITDEMKMAAARALADVIPATERTEKYIIPSIFPLEIRNEQGALVKVIDPHKAVAEAVIKVAKRSGLSRNEKLL